MLSPGTRIDDRYEIIAPLGSGGMGQVFRARRLRLDDEVAIKVMQTGPEAPPPELRERFLRESKACAQLRHPNIVGILDFGFHGAAAEGGVPSRMQPYMVMELLSGPSLADEIDLESPMPAAKVAAIIKPVAAALQLAHDYGITHRDLKPANIVAHRYESGERVYKVIDFGLAALQVASDQTRLTSPALFLGTLAYAAPEQVRGEPVTAKTDIYSLGVIAYEMLTGKRPFDAGNRMTFINELLTVRPVNPASRTAGLSAAIDGAVMRALAKDPAERWSTVVEFAEALDEAAGTADPRAREGGDSLLARYELGPVLGIGRLGSQVYRGVHRALGVPVAIRVVKRDEQPNWEPVRARFLLEAQTLQVPHPGVMQVRDYGEDERGVFLVTDLIEGSSLHRAMAEAGAFPWPRVARLLSQACDAVEAIHRKGGFIAGVNPDMIRLTTDEAGERLVMSSAGIRSVQDVLATMREQELRGQEASERELPYVAPEVLMGRAPDARADVFTLGVLAYRMATGRLPFRASSLPELMGQMLQMKPVGPAEIVATVPSAASAAIVQSLSGDPAARFGSISEFASALEFDRR
jgi:serine/threonine-protein kinase